MLIFLLSFISSLSLAQVHTATLSTVVDTNVGEVTVYGDAKIYSVEKPNASHPTSVMIPLVSANVHEMHSSILGAMKSLKKEKFLNASEYPEITVTQVAIDQNKTAKGIVRIKGYERIVSGTWAPSENHQIKITFKILLSDYSIAHRVLLFTIDDEAEVTVQMNDPF